MTDEPASTVTGVVRVLDPDGNVVAEYPGIELQMATEIGGVTEEGADDGSDR